MLKGGIRNVLLICVSGQYNTGHQYAMIPWITFMHSHTHIHTHTHCGIVMVDAFVV